MVIGASWSVFQSAPALERAGDLLVLSTGAMLTVFQSAPALERAGDAARAAEPEIDDMFQSAPALERAGDVWRLVAEIAGRAVSIRARSRESGRLWLPRNRVDVLVVSIRARSRESGRPRRRSARAFCAACFNPRPLSRERATPLTQVVVAKSRKQGLARTRVAVRDFGAAGGYSKDCSQAQQPVPARANLAYLRRRKGFAHQTTSGPSKSVARKRPYCLTRSSAGSVMR